MDLNNLDEIIDEMEKESFEDLHNIDDQSESVNDAKKQLNGLFDELRKKIKSLDQKDIQRVMNSVSIQVENIISSARKTISNVSENEKVQDTIDIVSTYTDKVMNDISKVFEKPSVKNAINDATQKVDEVLKSDRVKNAIDQGEILTQKATESIFKGLRKIIKNKENES